MKNRLFFLFILLIVSITFVNADLDIGLNREGIPTVTIDVPEALQFNNNTGAVNTSTFSNSSDFWDELDTPSDFTYIRSGDIIITTNAIFSFFKAINFGTDGLYNIGNISVIENITSDYYLGNGIEAGNITIEKNKITSDNGLISFGDENLTTNGSARVNTLIVGNDTGSKLRWNYPTHISVNGKGQGLFIGAEDEGDLGDHVSLLQTSKRYDYDVNSYWRNAKFDSIFSKENTGGNLIANVNTIKFVGSDTYTQSDVRGVMSQLESNNSNFDLTTYKAFDAGELGSPSGVTFEGSINNFIGYHMQDDCEEIASNCYSLYSEGEDVKSYHNGYFGIGQIPSYPLHIEPMYDDSRSIHIDGLSRDYNGTSSYYGVYSTRDANAGIGNATSLYAFRGEIYPKHTDATLNSNLYWSGLFTKVVNTGTINNDVGTNYQVNQRLFDLTIDDGGTYDTESTGRIYNYNIGGQITIDLDSTFSDSGGDIDNTPTLLSGSLTQRNYAFYADVVGNTVGSSISYGMYIHQVTGSDSNYGIWDNSGAGWVVDSDNTKIQLGETNTDLEIYSDGNNGVIDSTGDILIPTDLNVSGNLDVGLNITGNQIYGEMWNRTASASPFNFPIAAVGTYYNLTNLSVGMVNGFTFTQNEQVDGGSFLTTQVGGRYQATASLCSVVGTASGDLYGYAISHEFQRNNHNNCYARRTAVNKVGCIPITCMIDVPVGTQVNIQIEQETGGVARDIAFQTVNINLVRVGDIL